MNVKLLIDGIVRQTTVLLAQLSTTSGARAPWARATDEVFRNLAREIEAQGVGRSVVADMFGVALRSYQRKVQRLTESCSQRDQTLWVASAFDPGRVAVPASTLARMEAPTGSFVRRMMSVAS